MPQQIFCPADYTFEWKDGWYEWDRKKAHSLALKAKNAEVKRLKNLGHTVTTFTLKDSLISKGGIGSGNPHIELIVNAYVVNY